MQKNTVFLYYKDIFVRSLLFRAGFLGGHARTDRTPAEPEAVARTRQSTKDARARC